MKEREKYIQLAKMLDSSPVGAPLSKELLELLEIWYPEGDHLDMALCLNYRNTSLEDVAEKAGVPVEKAKEILEDMAARGTILSKPSGDTRKYRLWPMYAGLFEYTNMSSKYDPATHQKMNELWMQYYKKNMVHELGESETSWKRTLPAMGAYMDAEAVLPYEVATDLIKTQAKRIAVGICACREQEQKCDKPLETCLAFDEAAGFMIEYGMGREITVDEAAEILKKCEAAGLVHMTSNNKSNLLFMCNCCPDCCNILRTYTEFNYPDGVAKASVRSQVDASACIGCGHCEKNRCPVKGAIKVVNRKAVVNEELCIGCGLCVTECPRHAISLVKRSETPEYPETLGELSKVIWKTKQEHRADPDYVR